LLLEIIRSLDSYISYSDELLLCSIERLIEEECDEDLRKGFLPGGKGSALFFDGRGGGGGTGGVCRGFVE